MKKTLTLLIFLMLLVLGRIYSQTLTADAQVSLKNGNYQYYLGRTTDADYLLTSRFPISRDFPKPNGVIPIVKNRVNLLRIHSSTKEHVAIEINFSKTLVRYFDGAIADNKVMLFYVGEATDSEENPAYVDEFTLEGQFIGNRLVTSIDGWIGDHKGLKFLRDEKSGLYALIKLADNQPGTIVMLDGKFTQVAKERHESTAVFDVAFTDSGNFAMVVAKKQNVEVQLLNRSAKIIATRSLEIQEIATGFKIHPFIESNTVYVAFLTGVIENIEILAQTFHLLELDGTSLSLKNKKSGGFSEATILAYLGYEKLGRTTPALPSAEVADVVVGDNGQVGLILQRQYFTNGPSNIFYGCTYGNFVLLAINPDGTFSQNVLPRFANGIADDIYYLQGNLISHAGLGYLLTYQQAKNSSKHSLKAYKLSKDLKLVGTKTFETLSDQKVYYELRRPIYLDDGKFMLTGANDGNVATALLSFD